MLTGKEIRKKFVDYFESKRGHRYVKSSSLVPDNPTVLLTNAGMLQFVPIFLGYEPPPDPPRAVSVQKCIRAGGKDSDIDNVGRTPRHHTFFEMLGNFSFGNYFKKEIIPWAWEFITQELKLPCEKLWITVYLDDNESFHIWNKDIGIPEDRIIRKGRKDNFWGPPGVTGPCGPCSEIHYDLGELFGITHPATPEDLDTDRFVEIWNLVFMELFLNEEGLYSELKNKNIDTGMGLERITMALQNKTTTFETDLVFPLVQAVEKISGKRYGENTTIDTSIKIIADHVRCITFMAADGIRPSNIGREYVFRMILRRALRHGKLLGIDTLFLHQLVDTVISIYRDWYQELPPLKDKIKDVIFSEEERFHKTFDKGLSLLERELNLLKEGNKNDVPGDVAFELYDTHGFPLEVTIELAQEKGYSVNIDRFHYLMQEQKERSKHAHSKEILTENLVYVDIVQEKGSTEFLGYTQATYSEAKVIGIVQNGKSLDSFNQVGLDFIIVLDKTVFYGESGGQVGDSGIMQHHSCHIQVLDTQKYEGLFLHKCQLINGHVAMNDILHIQVNEERRHNIVLHHSTAHLLQSALKEVLGSDITQEGSNVNEYGARFDFKFNRALTQEEVSKVENLINDWITQNVERKTELMSIQDAMKCGAIALFGEKYGDQVNVVSMGDISKELCGGTHVQATGDIRLAKIISESSISAGVRRIEMVSGATALQYLENYQKIVKSISHELKVGPDEVYPRIVKIVEESKKSEKELQQVKSILVSLKIDWLVNQAEKMDTFNVLVQRVDDFDMNQLKETMDKLQSTLQESIIILASVLTKENRVLVLAKTSESLTAKGFHAANMLNKMLLSCEGKGGGSATYAQGGAKNITKLDHALQSILNDIKNMVKV